jgi:N-carbamoylputrescine amidase
VVLARAPADDEAVITVTLDLRRTDQVRTHWPFLRDRRIDVYGDLSKRYLGDEST